MAQRAVQGLHQALTDHGLPCSLQLVEGAAYVDRELVAVDAGDYTKVERLARAFANVGYQELSIERAPTVAELSRICEALAAGLQAKTVAVDELTAAGIAWREISSVGFDGAEGEAVDQEVFAMTHLAMAMADAERVETDLDRDPQWPWSDGLSIVRRLERGLAVDSAAVVRTLELSPGAWSVARRSVSVARCAQHALRVLGCAASLSRAVGHAAVAVAFTGLGQACPVDEAASQLLVRLQLSAADAASETTPHRLRMVTVVRTLASGARGDLVAVGRLVEAAYELELLRMQVRPGQVAPRIELLAVGMQQLDSAWMKFIVNIEGLLPPGSRVRLADGRDGIVLGAGDPINPWRPLVLCDGRVSIPDTPVRLP